MSAGRLKRLTSTKPLTLMKMLSMSAMHDLPLIALIEGNE
jgi:hypothetical protein